MSTRLDPEFDMEAFNRLPTEDVFDLKDADLEQLKRAFPYILKPNSAIALFHEQKKDGYDAGHPLQDAKSNLLIKLNITANLTKEIVPIISISRAGQCFLWEYRCTDSVTTSGLFPLYLLPDNQNNFSYQKFDNQFALFEELTAKPNSPNDRLFEFDLIASFQSCDIEGIVLLRLLTQFTEHIIKLDFGVNLETGPIPFNAINTPRTQYSKERLFRQIGGWDGDTALYWGELGTNWQYSGKVIIGSIRHIGSDSTFEVQSDFIRARVRAAVEKNGIVVIGGDEEELWLKRPDDTKPSNIDNNKILKGYVRALAVVPQKQQASTTPNSQDFIILVGCDDYLIYVMDMAGNKLQQIYMGGLIESILCINQFANGDADIVSVVRNKGIYCFRLFYAQLQFNNEFPIQKEYKAKLFEVIQQQRSLKIEVIQQQKPFFLYAQLNYLLSSTDSLDKLMAFTTIIENLNIFNAEQILDFENIFQQQPSVSEASDTHIANYTAYLIKQKIQELVNLPNLNQQLLCGYLQLLLFLTEGSFDTKTAVRNLEGWLKLLKLRHADRLAEEPSRLLDTIKNRLLNRKQLFCRAMEQLYLYDQKGDSLNKKQAMAEVLTTKLIFTFKFQRLFHEVVILPEEQGAHVDTVTMADFGQTITNLVYALRGENKLYSFRVISKQEGFDDGHYHHDITKVLYEGKEIIIQPTLRALVPLQQPEHKDECLNSPLLVVTSKRLGIAKKAESHVEYFHISTLPYWTAVACNLKNAHQVKRIAIAGEWRRKLWNAQSSETDNPVLVCFDFDEQKILSNDDFKHSHQIRTELLKPPSKDWEKALHFRDLFWDTEGNLWGVTSGEGYILRWQGAAETSDNSVNAEIIHTIGSPLYAILVNNDHHLLFCGGYDGILRAFSIQDLNAIKLAWSIPLPGAIRAITTHSFKLTDKQNFSELAIITETGHLVLYSFKGKCEGIIDVRQPLVSMFSGILRKGGAQHHFIGTLHGEVRLVEEIPQDFKTAFYHYLFPSKDREQAKIEKMYDLLIAYEKQFFADYKHECKSWCEKSAVLSQPFRAAWAAEQFLERSEEYELIIQMLEEVNQPTYSLSKVVLHRFVFAMLGQKLDEMPAQLHNRIVVLCKKQDDRAFANLILTVPATLSKNKMLYVRLFKIALNKMLTGQAFTIASILYRYRSNINEPSRLYSRTIDFFIINASKKSNQYQINTGFIEGILTLLFQRLHIQHGVLYALAGMQEEHVKLAKTLLQNKTVQQVLKNWVNMQGRLVLSPVHFQFWQNFMFALDNPDIEDELNKIIKFKHRYPLEDVNTLKHFMRLLPYHAASPDPNHLHNKWQVYLTLYERLWLVKSSIEQYLSVSNDEFDQLETDLAKFEVVIPFTESLHEFWKTAWQQELERLKEQRGKIRENIDTKDENLSELIRSFFRIINKVGFVRGRFYRFMECTSTRIEVVKPFRTLMLKLTSIEGEVASDYSLPYIGYPLVDDEKLDTYIPQEFDKNIIPFKLYLRNEPNVRQDKDNQHWDDVIGKASGEGLWLQIPVFYKKDNVNKIIGIFAFDWANLPTKYISIVYKSKLESDASIKLSKISHELYAIARNIGEALLVEQTQERLDKLNKINELDKRLLKGLEGNLIEKILLSHACKITEACGGLLIKKELNSDNLIIQQAIGKPQELLAGIKLGINKQSYPLVQAYTKKKAIYFPEWQRNPQKQFITHNYFEDAMFSEVEQKRLTKWLEKDIKAVIAFPIFSGEENVIGAVSLQSEKSYYAFDKIHIEALNHLMERIRWFIYALELDETRSMWQEALIHDLRSDLYPLRGWISLIPKDPDKFTNIAYLHWERLNTLCENFIKIKDMEKGYVDIYLIEKNISFCCVGEILKSYIDFYDLLLQERNQTVNVIPNDWSNIVWSCQLIGKSDIFELVLKNLLDNAFKYGKKRHPITIMASQADFFWQLTIINKGAMTEEDDKIKFEAHKKTQHSKGLHIGLAFCQKVVQIYNGHLAVHNDIAGDEVKTILNWRIKGE